MSNLLSSKSVQQEKTANLRQALKRYWGILALLIIALVGFGIWIGYALTWTGFGEFKNPDYKVFQRAKTLWDWLHDVIVPLLVVVGAAILTYWFSKRREALNRKFEENRSEEEHALQKNRFREDALQKYLDYMTQLILKEQLMSENPTPHAREIARYRTLTTLQELDEGRKATLLCFLHESGLIKSGKSVLSLEGADLSKANLVGVKLNGADLSGSILSGANLKRADLSEATLDDTKLDEADLSYAILTNAKFTHEQLVLACSWVGITPLHLEETLNQRRGREQALPPQFENWLEVTTPISHKTTTSYDDNRNERYGQWLVTRGRHDIGPLPDFRIGIYLVTNELFSQFIKANGYETDHYWLDTPAQSRHKFRCQDGSFGPSTWPSKGGFLEGRGRHPVSGISYYEALAFCRWLQETSSPEDGWNWCLPTENMWELVARTERGHLYPWGQSFDQDHGDQVHRCNSVETGVGTTTDVNRFPKGKSEKGVCYDMAGNVWELVSEDRREHWYCVLRGGSYRNNQNEVKSSLRLWGVPRDHRPPDFGFRCAQVRDFTSAKQAAISRWVRLIRSARWL